MSRSVAILQIKAGFLEKKIAIGCNFQKNYYIRFANYQRSRLLNSKMFNFLNCCMKKISLNKLSVVASIAWLYSNSPAKYFDFFFLNFLTGHNSKSFCSADAIQYISGYAAPYTEISTTIQLPKLRL